MRLTYAFILLIMLMSCTTTPHAEDILIGADFPLSGGLSVYGEALTLGFGLGVEDINNKGGVNGRKIRLITEDNIGNPQRSLDAAQKLITQDNVDMLLSTMVGVTGPIVPVAEQNQKVLLYAAAVDSFADENTWIFKDSVDAYYDCGKLAEWATARGMKRFALFGTQAEFTQKCHEILVEKGINLVMFETFPPGVVEYKSPLTKISTAKPDALFLSAYSNECIHLWKQISELGLEMTFLLPFTQGGCGEGRSMKEASAVTSPIIGMDFLVNESSPQYQQFITQFRKKHGKDPEFPWFTWLSYDWAHYIALAFEQCEKPSDGLCLRSALEKTDYEGAGGKVMYQGKHKTFRPREFIEFKDLRWETLR